MTDTCRYKFLVNDDQDLLEISNLKRQVNQAEKLAEFYRNRGRDVTFVWGVDQVPLPYDVHPINHPQLHEWFVVYLHNSFFDTPPDGGVLYPLLMLRDACNAGREWRRDSGEGNVYLGQGNVIEVDDSQRIDFPLNIVEILADVENGGVRLNALTRTPGLREIQLRLNNGRWRRFRPGEHICCTAPETRFAMSPVNQLGVRGVESSVTIRAS